MKKVLVIAMIIIFSFLAGCGEEPECEYNSDCSAGKCFTAECVDGECQKTPEQDCCGNRKAEEGENACNCPQDVQEECEGKVTVETRGDREIKSEFLEWTCKDEKCVTGLDETEQRQIPLTFDENFGRFKISFTVNIKKPFNIDKDKIEIEGKLRSMTDSVKPPIKLKEIKIIGDETLFGSKDLNEELSKEGDKFTTKVPIDYVPEKPELEKRLKMKIFYGTTYYLDREAGRTEENPAEEFIKVFDKKLYLVNTGEEK